MDLEIADTILFREIQEAFNKVYPYLWIDFFYPQATTGYKHFKLEKVKPETAVKCFYAYKGTKKIKIDGSRSVAELESDFTKMLHVEAKVLRKLGNVWVNTSYTGNWTLENQNDEGKQLMID